jgi:hypothetical protein
MSLKEASIYGVFIVVSVIMTVLGSAEFVAAHM